MVAMLAVEKGGAGRGVHYLKYMRNTHAPISKAKS